MSMTHVYGNNKLVYSDVADDLATYRTQSQIEFRQAAETKCIVLTHKPTPFCAKRVEKDSSRAATGMDGQCMLCTRSSCHGIRLS